MRLELAWGRIRRAYLKAFRRGYVDRMRTLRRGDYNPCPHEVLDPRDLKFYRNQGGYWWDRAHDPFVWRDRLPFARDGLAELVLFGGTTVVATLLVALVSIPAAIVPAVLALEFFWFFRDPRRTPPPGKDLVLAPADGKVVSIESIPYDEFIGGPAVLVGVFLSIFNVHINRAPINSRIIGMTYRRGKFLNALLPESARENERMTLRLEANEAPHRRFVVRQIAGALARRIVCTVSPGEDIEAGARFGMIKLGSRTELVLPAENGLAMEVRVGDHIKAGVTIVARFKSEN
jgi:phosphatidylserine decarboxylase